MKAVVIKGMSLPDENGVIDVRIYNNYAASVCGPGCTSSYSVEEIDVPDEPKTKSKKKESK